MNDVLHLPVAEQYPSNTASVSFLASNLTSGKFTTGIKSAGGLHRTRRNPTDPVGQGGNHLGRLQLTQVNPAAPARCGRHVGVMRSLSRIASADFLRCGEYVGTDGAEVHQASTWQASLAPLGNGRRLHLEKTSCLRRSTKQFDSVI